MAVAIYTKQGSGDEALSRRRQGDGAWQFWEIYYQNNLFLGMF